MWSLILTALVCVALAPMVALASCCVIYILVLVPAAILYEMATGRKVPWV